MPLFRRYALLLMVVGCGGRMTDGADAGADGMHGVSIPTGDGGTGLPCEVAAVLQANCTSCHGAVLSGGAPFALVTRPDLLSASTIAGASRAQRSVVRMGDTASPMPPSPRALVSAADLSVFSAWVTAGSPEGRCESAGAVDAGPVPTTCASNTFWTRGNDGNIDMNPGYACVSCHSGQNFQNQNPSGERKSSLAFQFMGTLFPELHAKDRCDAQLPSGVTVEILDKNHNVALTIGSNILVGEISARSGNFFNLTKTSSVQLPYTARVKYNGKSYEMMTPQTSGDCNSCHTEQGLNGAPGRITVPQ